MTALTREQPLSASVLLRGPWWLLAGLLAMYVPTYVDLYETFWRAGRAVHGPVILAWIAWLVWRDRTGLTLESREPVRAGAVALFALGLFCYALGRSQSFIQLEIGSQIPLLLGLAWATAGRAGLRRLGVPIAFTIFVIPVPGTLLDQLLLPLKQIVSAIADNGLHALGYPIARNGVVLMIGRYDLLIADACSGLNSMVALSGMGLIYTYVVGRRSRWHNTLLLLSVLPVAFAANVVRVVGLLLTTYYFGDAAGRAFHSSAAWLEIVLAFGGFFAVDYLLGLMRAGAPSPAAGSVS
ncbi:MAG TPA: exosortase [Steroidobacteraceae bacterium]|nr:exosortase [Steroidobacteraceae bacterium]